MLFSIKENVFMCLVATKIRFTENQFRCLVHSNIFTENALHTQFCIHFLNCKLAHNESIPHSFTKETKPSKKIHQIRSNWDRAAEEKMKSRGEGEIRGEIGAIVRQAARSTIAIDERCDRQRSLFFLSLSLRSGLSLLSLSLSFSGNEMKWKWRQILISVVKASNFGQQEMIFRKISFSVAAKHAGLGENDSLKSFSPQKNAP